MDHCRLYITANGFYHRSNSETTIWLINLISYLNVWLDVNSSRFNWIWLSRVTLVDETIREVHRENLSLHICSYFCASTLVEWHQYLNKFAGYLATLEGKGHVAGGNICRLISYFFTQPRNQVSKAFHWQANLEIVDIADAIFFDCCI